MDIAEVMLTICVILLSGIGIVFFILSLKGINKQKNELREIQQKNKDWDNYLRKLQTIIDNNIQNSQNRPVELEDEDFKKLYYEIHLLRSGINNYNELKSNQLDILLSNEGIKSFDYNKFVFQLSQMTNIQYLFSMLNTQKEEQYSYAINVLSDVLHTIKNPLAGIKAVISILKNEKKNDKEIMEKILDLEDYIKSIDSILNTYRMIAKDNSEQNGQIISLNEEVEKRSKLLMISLGKKVQFKNNICEVNLDKTTIDILILSLSCIWENSISFSKDNGEITTSAFFSENMLTIEVVNRGPVINSKIIEKIFDQGFSTRGSTGRGLSIAKKAIETKLNGTIVCKNIGNEIGVKFTIIIEVKRNNGKNSTN